jgi:hypothetical protein
VIFSKIGQFFENSTFLCELLYFIDKTHNFTHLYMLGLLPGLYFIGDTSIFLKFVKLGNFTKIGKKTNRLIVINYHQPRNSIMDYARSFGVKIFVVFRGDLGGLKIEVQILNFFQKSPEKPKFLRSNVIKP